MIDTRNFYNSLPTEVLPLSRLYLQNNRFHDVPGDWNILITDILNSSSAVANGDHQSVNLIATGSIVAVLNIAHSYDLEVPFFFGGDGATFIIPSSMMDDTIAALQVYQANVKEEFNLFLRVGSIPVANVYKASIKLQIAKAKISSLHIIPVVIGEGLMYAEQIIKSSENSEIIEPTNPAILNMTGLQCKWDKIPPPDNHEEVVSLLALSSYEASQGIAYSKVMQLLDYVYGDIITRRSISIPKLKLVASLDRIRKELQAKMDKNIFYSTIVNWVQAMAGKLFFKTWRGRSYLKKLVDLTDNIVLDGKINTVISGTVAQRKELQEGLIKLEEGGEIIFGFYVSDSTIMSCYVQDMNDKHIHFVDGAGGGYTEASKFLKKKLKVIKEHNSL